MSAVCPLNHLQFSSFGSPTSSLEHQLSSSSSTNSLILPHHRRSSMNDIHCEFSANKMAAPRSFSTSSSMLEYPRFHTRRNAVQYSPAQLRSALQSAPMPLSVPVPVPCAVSDSTQAFSLPSKHNNSHGLTIQVPPIVRAMSAEDKSSRQRRRNRFRPSQQRHRSSAAPTASPRLPPAPPSSPILRSPFVSASPSPHLIPSPPSALCRPPPNSPSIFSFQALSPALQQLRTRHRVQRSSSVPELFLGVSTASSFAWDSEETKAETEMSPKASGLRFERIMDGIEFGRLLQQVEENVEPQEEKYNLQAVNAGKVQRLNVHTPRVSSSYNSGYSNVPSPSRTMVTSPPLQAVLYSHLQHLNNRLELEEKEAEPEKNALEQAKEPHGRRERRNGIFYSCADSQQLREDLAAMIRQQQNPLFLFAALPNPSNSPPAIRATHRRRPAMLNPPQFDAHIPFPEDWMQTACDVSECEAENEADIEEAVEFSSVASPASNHSSSPHADRE